MTPFDELQHEHERLLDQVNAAADPAQIVPAAQSYIERARTAATQISDPRQRDQLRANLRYWASFVYDHRGAYPNTGLLPATTLPPAPRLSRWRVWLMLISGGVVTLLAVIVLLTTVTLPAAILPPPPTPTMIPVPLRFTPIFIRLTPEAIQIMPQALPVQISYQVVTFGPSPFDPDAWVIDIQLLATGGDNHYVFWVNGQRLAGDRYTIDGAACRAATLTMGATSNGQALRREVTLKSPLATCP